jgi:hypothetical protein
MSKKYRIEIKSLFIKDVEANNEQEAKAKIKEIVNPACSIDFANDNGTFFYEEFDFNNAKISEQ